MTLNLKNCRGDETTLDCTEREAACALELAGGVQDIAVDLLMVLARGHADDWRIEPGLDDGQFREIASRVRAWDIPTVSGLIWPDQLGGA
jgi:hypothetical protein